MDIRRLMNQIKMNPLNAKKVIFEFENEKWIFEDFELIETNFMGEKVFQLKGVPKILKNDEKEEDEKKEEDIKLVMEELNISREKAIELLEKANWEIAEALALGEELKEK
jgi:alpha-NAC-related protein